MGVLGGRLAVERRHQLATAIYKMPAILPNKEMRGKNPVCYTVAGLGVIAQVARYVGGLRNEGFSASGRAKRLDMV